MAVKPYRSIAETNAKLFAQSEAGDQLAIRLDVLALQVVKELAALAHHAQEPGALLPVLHAVQDALGHVPADAVPAIAEASCDKPSIRQPSPMNTKV